MLIPKYGLMLDKAVELAKESEAEGGIPFGAAVFMSDGALAGAGRNMVVQTGLSCAHAEIAAANACPLSTVWADCILVCTSAPCMMCAGMAVQFGFAAVVVGSSSDNHGALEFLRKNGIHVVDLKDSVCAKMEASFRQKHGLLWQTGCGE